jgi:hypothetical protein
MATSSVSALDQDTWQLVATNTPTTGSSTTFSSLSGYKRYMLAFDNLANSSGGGMNMTFNSASTKYYGGTAIHGQATYQTDFSYIHLYYNASGLRGTLTIDNVNNGGPKIVDGVLMSQANNSEICFVRGGWLTTDTITSISINCGGTYSSGTVKLYGIAG